MLLSELAHDATLDLPSFLRCHPEPILVSWTSDEDESPVGFHTPDGGNPLPAPRSDRGSRTTHRLPSDQTPRDNGTPLPDGDAEETEALERPHTPPAGSRLDSPDASTAATAVRLAMDLVCIPLVKSNRNPFAQMITAGRTPNNDVVLRDATVSKFHAYFARRGAAWWLHDQSSTNGTYVARTKIGSVGAEVRNGFRVAFGQRLVFRFFTPEGIHEFLNQQ